MVRSTRQRSWKKQCDFVSAKSVQSDGIRLRTKLKEFSAAVKWLVALDRHEFVERKSVRCARLRMTTMVFGAVLRLYVLCMEANLELTQTAKKLKTRIKEKKGGRNIGQRFLKGRIIEFHRD